MIELLSHAVKSFLKGFLGIFLVLGILSAVFSSSAEANDVDPPVKMSKSAICHAVDSSYYKRTKNFTSFETLKECINAGGRLPKNYKSTETVKVATGSTIKKNTVTRVKSSVGSEKYDNGIYIGEFLNGKRHGHGTYKWSLESEWAGDIYIGEFLNNKRTGEGIYIWNAEPWTGDKYIGQFKNDKRTGQGRLIFANGNIQEGIFKNDIFMGTI